MPIITEIEWTDAIVSIDEVLNEHALDFVKFTNIFISKMSTGKQPESLVKFLSFLNDYSKYHFIYQESVMELKNFPGEADHKVEHKEFIYTISKLFKEVIAYKKVKYLSERDFTEGYKNIIETTYDFAISWYGSHIANLDKRFNDFLKFENS